MVVDDYGLVTARLVQLLRRRWLGGDGAGLVVVDDEVDCGARGGDGMATGSPGSQRKDGDRDKGRNALDSATEMLTAYARVVSGQHVRDLNVDGRRNLPPVWVRIDVSMAVVVMIAAPIVGVVTRAWKDVLVIGGASVVGLLILGLVGEMATWRRRARDQDSS